MTKVTKVTLAVVWQNSRRELLSFLRKSAYRSNETFFSRTHSFGCGLNPVDVLNSSSSALKVVICFRARNFSLLYSCHYRTVRFGRKKSRSPLHRSGGGFKWFSTCWFLYMYTVQFILRLKVRRCFKQKKCIYLFISKLQQIKCIAQ